jgi:DNA-binding XRE family transcriptional regulator
MPSDTHAKLFVAYCDNSTTKMPVTRAQVNMARAALDWTVRDLAAVTGLHRNTINNVEVGRYAGDPATLQKIEKVLVAAGIEFIDENGGGPGVRLRKRFRSKKPK